MSLYSYSSISPSTSSLKWSESSNSYCLLPSSSSITTVSSQPDNERGTVINDDDDEQWPVPPVTETIVQDHWRIEKNISLKDPRWSQTGCILKATMTKEQILIHDSSSTQSTIVPGKHISMKVVFGF